METRPKEKSFSIPSFAALSARGIIRDQGMRRRTMLVLLVVAVLMLALGASVLREVLNPHEHPLWFICYWLVCAWLTVSTLLLAIFDLLLVRAEARAARRQFAQRVVEGRDVGEP